MTDQGLASYTPNVPTTRFFKAKPMFLRRLLQTGRLPRRGISTFLLVLVWLALSAVLAILPSLWVHSQEEEASRRFFAWGHDQGHRIVERWGQSFMTPEFRTGDEPALRERLAQDPLVRALVDPGSGEVWTRREDCLVKAPDLPETERLRLWARSAKEAGKPTWIPPLRLDPEALNASTLLVPGGRFWAVKEWRPGSAEVDRFLLGILGAHSRMTFGILHWEKRSAAERRAERERRAHEHPPESLQIHPEDAFAHFQCMGALFGDVWVPGVGPSRATMDAERTSLAGRKRLAWALYGLTLALSGAGLFLYFHARYRERLEADRLASLTHSLKTPLAVLKLKCDTARNPDLPRAQQEAYLSGIGDEVDQLVQVIESGLEGIRPRRQRASLDVIGADFFERIDDDLRAAFEDAERDMELEVQSQGFLANEPALYAALSTLLENALLHGQGGVELKVVRRKGMVAIQVRDQGPGVSPDRLASIFGGRQATLARRRAREARRSQGMGLFLLAQLAEREGWGLLFRSEPGVGFEAVLEIRQ